MRKFQVLPIKLSLKSNKYAKSREIVSENQLMSPAVDLIAAGFIKEVFDDVEKEVVKDAIDLNPNKDSDPKKDSDDVEKDSEGKEADGPVKPLTKEDIADLKKAPVKK